MGISVEGYLLHQNLYADAGNNLQNIRKPMPTTAPSQKFKIDVPDVYFIYDCYSNQSCQTWTRLSTTDAPATTPYIKLQPALALYSGTNSTVSPPTLAYTSTPCSTCNTETSNNGCDHCWSIHMSNFPNYSFNKIGQITGSATVQLTQFMEGKTYMLCNNPSANNTLKMVQQTPPAISSDTNCQFTFQFTVKD